MGVLTPVATKGNEATGSISFQTSWKRWETGSGQTFTDVRILPLWQAHRLRPLLKANIIWLVLPYCSSFFFHRSILDSATTLVLQKHHRRCPLLSHLLPHHAHSRKQRQNPQQHTHHIQDHWTLFSQPQRPQIICVSVFRVFPSGHWNKSWIW